MRQCGDCTLCCKLLPVKPLGKLANQRCAYQRRTGCRVYHTFHMPTECKLWNCRWLTNDDTANLSRPNRVGYVIDTVPDFITGRPHDGGPDKTMEAVQIWVDPQQPNAWRDPDLLDYLDRRGKEGIVAIIRTSSSESFVVFPPSLTGEDEFCEYHDGVSIERDHTPLEIFEAIHGRD